MFVGGDAISLRSALKPQSIVTSHPDEAVKSAESCWLSLPPRNATKTTG
jgi:hypothetical protein